MLSACLFACLVANLSLCLRLLAWVVISQHDCFSLRRLLIYYGVLKLCFFVYYPLTKITWDDVPRWASHQIDPGWCSQVTWDGDAGGYYPLIKLTQDDVPMWPRMVSPGGYYPIIFNLSPQFGKTSCRTRFSPNLSPRRCQFGQTSSCTRHLYDRSRGCFSGFFVHEHQGIWRHFNWQSRRGFRFSGV